MELFDDHNRQLYHALREDYQEWRHNEYSRGNFSVGWTQYINSQHLGVCVTKELYPGNSLHARYTITDTKQWCITRLRYGII